VLERLITNLKNVFNIPELRNRILFTLGMLAVYRIGAHIPTPGINSEALSEFLQKQGGALLGFLDIFSGGALSRLTIFALGIMPYISASIILQLLTVVIPHLTKLAKEGERDHSIHPIRHHWDWSDSSLRHRHWSRRDEPRRLCPGPGVELSVNDDAHADSRHCFSDVAW